MNTVYLRFFAFIFFMTSYVGLPLPDSRLFAETKKPAVLRTYTMVETTSFDPIDRMGKYKDSLYNRLLKYHYLKRPLTLEPELLTELPKREKDGWHLLTLRQGIYFHDADCFPGGKGRELTADDVIYSFKRFADGRRNQDTFDRLEMAVEGMQEFHQKSLAQGAQFKPDETPISGLEKIDRYRLRIKFARADGPRYLTLGYLSIVAREAVETYGEQFKFKPVGTGPFRLASFTRGAKIILEKNPRYWETYPKEGNAPSNGENLLADAGKSLPFMDRIEIQEIMEMLPVTLKFLAGELDEAMIDHDSYLKMIERSPSGVPRLKPPYDRKAKLLSGYMNLTYFFRVNMKDPLLGKNKALREAIALGINSQGYLDTLRHGRGELAQSLVPLSNVGNAHETGVKWLPYNLELAKQKLREAGYPDGKGLPPIKMEYASTGQFFRQTHEYFRHSLSQIGITLEGSFQSATGFYKKVESGNFQLCWIGWDSSFADQAYQMLKSDAGPIPNPGSFSSAEFDKVFQDMLKLPDGPARIPYLKKLHEIVKSEVPIILIMHPYSAVMYNPGLGNIPTDSSGVDDFRYVKWKTP